MCRHNRREVVRLTTRNRFLTLRQCVLVVLLARSATLQAGGMRSFLVCTRKFVAGALSMPVPWHLPRYFKFSPAARKKEGTGGGLGQSLRYVGKECLADYEVVPSQARCAHNCTNSGLLQVRTVGMENEVAQHFLLRHHASTSTSLWPIRVLHDQQWDSLTLCPHRIGLNGLDLESMSSPASPRPPLVVGFAFCILHSSTRLVFYLKAA